MDLNNRDTREPATPAEYAAAEQRARVILTSPYASSPDQIEWALQFPGLEDVFWESLGERHAEDREILTVNSTSTPAEVAAIARLIAAAPALLAACRAARTRLQATSHDAADMIDKAVFDQLTAAICLATGEEAIP